MLLKDTHPFILNIFLRCFRILMRNKTENGSISAVVTPLFSITWWIHLLFWLCCLMTLSPCLYCFEIYLSGIIAYSFAISTMFIFMKRVIGKAIVLSICWMKPETTKILYGNAFYLWFYVIINNENNNQLH